MLGLNFLVANQIDPAIDELTQGGAGRRRSARDSPDSRQPVSREGPGRPRDPGAPGAAAAARPAQARARQRAALPRPRLQAAAASSIARSRRSPKCCGSIPTTATRCRTSRSCTRSSISGPRPTRRGRSSRRSTARSTQARASGDPRLPRERARHAGAEADGLRRGGAPLRRGHRARCRRTRRRT